MIDESKIDELISDISSVLNKHSVDTDLATPDFILAGMIVGDLQTYGKAVFARSAWFKGQLEEGEPLSVRNPQLAVEEGLG